MGRPCAWARVRGRAAALWPRICSSCCPAPGRRSTPTAPAAHVYCCQVHGENTLLDLKPRPRPTGWLFSYLGLFQVSASRNPHPHCCLRLQPPVLAGRHGQACKQQALPSMLPHAPPRRLVPSTSQGGELLAAHRGAGWVQALPVRARARARPRSAATRRRRRPPAGGACAFIRVLAPGVHAYSIPGSPAHCRLLLGLHPRPCALLQLCHKGKGSSEDRRRLELTAKWLGRCWDSSDTPEICT